MATNTSATAVPARTTDPRQTDNPMLTNTATPGSVAPAISVAPNQTPAPGFGIGTTAITPENTLRNQRLNFEATAPTVSAPTGYEKVKAQKTVGSVRAAFDAAQPQMMQEFRDASQALAQRTAAMGRTGSGLFNRDTGFVGDRALQAREALFGNLAFQATQADANRALQAALGNQSAGIQSNSLGAQIAMANANNALNVDLARQNHFADQQAREDAMAREAMQNAQVQAMLLSQGYSNNPGGAIYNAAQTGIQGAGAYGGNASDINSQVGKVMTDIGASYANGPTVSPRPDPYTPAAVNPNLLRDPSFSLPTPWVSPNLYKGDQYDQAGRAA
jgi:hypothetical protein